MGTGTGTGALWPLHPRGFAFQHLEQVWQQPLCLAPVGRTRGRQGFGVTTAPSEIPPHSSLSPCGTIFDGCFYEPLSALCLEGSGLFEATDLGRQSAVAVLRHLASCHWAQGQHPMDRGAPSGTCRETKSSKNSPERLHKALGFLPAPGNGQRGCE